MTNVVLHPELARIIARAINDRSVADDMISAVIWNKEFSFDDWLFWRDEHAKATNELGALGIRLHTYEATP